MSILAASCAPSPLPPADILLLYTSDTESFVDPCGCCNKQMGGLPRRARLLSDLRSELAAVAQEGPAAASNDVIGPDTAATNLLLLDCGNFLSTGTATDVLRAGYYAAEMANLGYAAVGLGMQEATAGQATLLEVLTRLGSIPVVSANVSFSGSGSAGEDLSGELARLVKPAARLTVAGNTLVVTSVTTAAGLPHGMDTQLGVAIAEPAAALAEVAAGVSPGEWLIVLTTGLSTGEAQAVRGVPGVDLVVGSGRTGNPPRPAEPGGPAILPRIAFRGRAVGRGRLELRPGMPLALHNSRVHDMHKGYADDPGTHERVVGLAAQIRLLHEEEVDNRRRIDRSTVVDYMGSSSCRECHAAEDADFRETRHSKAFQTLVRHRQSRNATCLPCHTVGYGLPTGFNVVESQQRLVAVGCEVCHGPGEVHIQQVRGQTLTGTLHGLDSHGLRPVTVETCISCHTSDTDPQFSAGKLKLVDHR